MNTSGRGQYGGRGASASGRGTSGRDGPPPSRGGSTSGRGGPPPSRGGSTSGRGGPPPSISGPPPSISGPPPSISGPPPSISGPPMSRGGPPMSRGGPPMSRGGPPMSRGGPTSGRGGSPASRGGSRPSPTPPSSIGSQSGGTIPSPSPNVAQPTTPNLRPSSVPGPGPRPPPPGRGTPAPTPAGRDTPPVPGLTRPPPSGRGTPTPSGRGTPTPSGRGTPTPGRGTPTPGRGTPTPGRGTPTPGRGTPTPGRGTPGQELTRSQLEAIPVTTTTTSVTDEYPPMRRQVPVTTIPPGPSEPVKSRVDRTDTHISRVIGELPQQAVIDQEYQPPETIRFEPQVYNVHIPTKTTEELREFLSVLLVDHIRAPNTLDEILSDENMKRWEKAFTHITYTAVHHKQGNYEREENYGDKVVGLIFAGILRKNGTDYDQEKSSEFHAHYMSKREGGQPDLAKSLGLQDFIRSGHDIEGHRSPITTKMIGDVFESFFGTLFILGEDITPGSGYMYCMRLMEKIFEDKPLDEKMAHQQPTTIFGQNMPLLLDKSGIRADGSYYAHYTVGTAGISKLRLAANYMDHYHPDRPNRYRELWNVLNRDMIVIGIGEGKSVDAAKIAATEAAMMTLSTKYNLTISAIEKITIYGDLIQYKEQVDVINNLLRPRGMAVARLKSIKVEDEVGNTYDAYLFVRMDIVTIIPYAYLTYVTETGSRDSNSNSVRTARTRLLDLVIAKLRREEQDGIIDDDDQPQELRYEEQVINPTYPEEIQDDYSTSGDEPSNPNDQDRGEEDSSGGNEYDRYTSEQELEVNDPYNPTEQELEVNDNNLYPAEVASELQ